MRSGGLRRTMASYCGQVGVCLSAPDACDGCYHRLQWWEFIQAASHWHWMTDDVDVVDI